MDHGQRARHARLGPGARLPDQRAGRRDLRLAVAVLGRERRRAGRGADAQLPRRVLAARPNTRSARTSPRSGWPSPAKARRWARRSGSGAFIARHGSWNRKPPAGYDVVFVRFDERGNPLGKPVKVLEQLPRRQRPDARPPDLGGVGQDRRAAGQRRHRQHHLARHRARRPAGRRRKRGSAARACRRSAS